MAVYYMTLTGGGGGGSTEGQLIWEEILNASARGVQIRMVVNAAPLEQLNETEYLRTRGLAKVRYANLTRFWGSGVQHVKLAIGDGRDIVLGSANWDWRSLSQVKELGLLIENATCLAHDLGYAFEVLWGAATISEDSASLSELHSLVRAQDGNLYSERRNASVRLNGKRASIFFSAAPPPLVPTSRTGDLDAILHVIDSAQQRLCVEVMDYVPASLYMPNGTNRYWPPIDDALRAAAFRGVQVRLLVANWTYSDPQQITYLRSLAALAPNLRVRLFVVPYLANQTYVNYTRVNHAKFSLNESRFQIGTSNWVADYFITTTGVSAIVEEEGLRDTLERIFDRDWNSPYAYDLDPTATTTTP